MYTLPRQFELLSDAWLDEARTFLEREAREGRRLPAFSLSERFTDAPPHLGLPDDVARGRCVGRRALDVVRGRPTRPPTSSSRATTRPR